MVEKIIVIGSKIDLHVSEVVEQAASEFCYIDIYTLPKVKVDYRTNEIKFDNQILKFDQSTKVWWRQKGPFVELSPVANHTLEALERKEYFEKTWYKFTMALSVFSSNTRFTNPIASRLRSNNKGYQLKVASEVGFLIPPTIITNDVEQAKSFSSDVVLIKSLSDATIGYSTTGSNLAFAARRVSVDMLTENKDAFSLHPVILQDYVEKEYELRIYWVAGDVIAVRIDSQADDTTKADWRPGQGNSSMFTLATCKDGIKQKIAKYMKVMQLDFGAFDFIVTPENEYVFLECNPDGQWLFTNRASAEVISLAMAKHMDSF